jgi:hypothetical protein
MEIPPEGFAFPLEPSKESSVPTDDAPISPCNDRTNHGPSHGASDYPEQVRIISNVVPRTIILSGRQQQKPEGHSDQDAEELGARRTPEHDEWCGWKDQQ